MMNESIKNEYESRVLIYSFLARAFRVEVDCMFLDDISKFDYDIFDEKTSKIDSGFRQLKEFVQNRNSETELNLARDYAKIFLGAGLKSSGGAYPYESYYMSEDHLFMQEERDEVMFCYADEMLEKSDKFKEHEDHIAFELEYMAYLIDKEFQARQSENKDIADKYRAKQKEFLEKHLSRWVRAFVNDIKSLSENGFYSVIGTILLGLIEEEEEYLELKSS